MMKSKLHFGILIVVFIFLGRYVESTVSANQQIVIQFSDTDITINNVQSTIETIQKKLQKIGVKHIEVKQNQSGQLKITYYSSNDVSQIEKILSKEQDLKFAFCPIETSIKLPNQKHSKDYELKISEIQKSSNSSDWGFEGVEVVELNHKSDRFNHFKVSSSGFKNNTESNNNLIEVAVELYKTVAPTSYNHSYKIPEVRAGPIS